MGFRVGKIRDSKGSSAIFFIQKVYAKFYMSKNLSLSIAFFISSLGSGLFFYYVHHLRDNSTVKYKVINPDGTSSRAPENILTDFLQNSSLIGVVVGIVLLYTSIRYLVKYFMEGRGENE